MFFLSLSLSQRFNHLGLNFLIVRRFLQLEIPLSLGNLDVIDEPGRQSFLFSNGLFNLAVRSGLKGFLKLSHHYPTMHINIKVLFICLTSASPILASRFTSAVRAMPNALR